MKNPFYVLFISLIISNLTYSQNLVVNTLNGIDNYNMSNVVKLSFTENREKLKIHLSNNSTFTYTIDSIDYLTFNSQVSELLEILSKSVKVFPNPFSNEINIEMNEDLKDNFYVKIIDQNGIIILEKQSKEIENGKFRVDEKMKISPGLYFIEITSHKWKYATSLIQL